LAVYKSSHDFKPENAHFCWQSSANQDAHGPFSLKM